MAANYRIIAYNDVTADIDDSADVIVIGTGAGGAPMAAELAEGGLSVIMVEEGSYWTTPDYTIEPGRGLHRYYRAAGTAMILGKPAIAFAEGRCVGGSTVLNGGMCWRTPEVVLDRWTHEHGVAGVSAKELEPVFERVEERYYVRKQDPESIGLDNKIILRGAEKLGWKVVENTRNQIHCAGANSCIFGCPTGAKQSTALTYVPYALAAGARLYTNCRVDRIAYNGSRATGVEGRIVDHFGKTKVNVRLRAKAVIVCAGASETPALLMRSKLRSPMLGKNLQVHPNGKSAGVYDEYVDSWVGVHQSHQIREFYDEGIVLAYVGIPPGFLAMTLPLVGKGAADEMMYFRHLLNGGCLVEDTGRGRVVTTPGGNPVMLYNINDYDFYKVKRGVSLMARLHFAAGAKRVTLPFSNLTEIHSPDELPKIMDPGIKKQHTELMTVHIMGSAAMGSNPRRSVVDSWGKVHGMDNLYISDASLFPTPVGVNPQETIIALSTRNAFRILDSWKA